MRFEIVGHKYGVRKCTITQEGVRCPNASLIGFGRATAKPNDLIEYTEDSITRVGRVLGRCLSPAGAGLEAFDGLAVLTLSTDGTFCYPRWVEAADVVRITDPCTQFARWFFQAKLPTPDVVLQLSHHGTLAERYIANPDCGPASLRVRDRDHRGFLWGKP
jgi:hypothetical protein